MKRYARKLVALGLMLAVLLGMAGLSAAWAEEDEILKGVASTKVFFDFRNSDPKYAAVHAKLILLTHKDLKAMGKKPEFVVGFMSSAVKLVSSQRPGYGMADKADLDEIAKALSQMAQAGIRLEVCSTAAEYFKIDPATLHKDLKQVKHGWISEIGYQAKGYGLVPVY